MLHKAHLIVLSLSRNPVTNSERSVNVSQVPCGMTTLGEPSYGLVIQQESCEVLGAWVQFQKVGAVNMSSLQGFILFFLVIFL